MVMMITLGNGVFSFTMDPEFGEFVLSKSQVQIPNPPRRIYSINSGNAEMWDQPTKDFIRWTKMQEPHYSSRYIGSMVSDVHRTILYGGIFMYPADSNRHLNGKLRLLYQGFPMAFLCEQAGGKASTGSDCILDLQPTVRVPCIPTAPIRFVDALAHHNAATPFFFFFCYVCVCVCVCGGGVIIISHLLTPVRLNSHL